MFIVCASALKGAYEGFATASLNFVLLVISAFFSVVFSPMMARSLLVDTQLSKTLLYFTEDISRIDTVEHAKATLSSLTPAEISDIVSKAELPAPFGALLEQNMLSRAFDGLQLYTVEEYFNTTIVHTIINMFSILLLFIAIYAVTGFLLASVDYAFRLPMLAHADWVAGALMGLVRGICLCYVLFFMLPAAQVAVGSISLVDSQIQNSQWLLLFTRDNMLWNFVKGIVV